MLWLTADVQLRPAAIRTRYNALLSALRREVVPCEECAKSLTSAPFRLSNALPTSAATAC
jgi:hypothetical protein